MGIFSYKKNVWLSIIIILAILTTTLYILGSFEIKKEKEEASLNNLISYNAPQIPERNITNEIFTGVLNEVAAANIIEQNTDSSGLLVPSHSSIENITSQALADFNPAIYKPEIKNVTLKISKNNSYTSIVKYIKNFATIIQNSIDIIKTPTKYSTVEDVILNQRDVYQKSLLDFYNLEVPSSMLDFHKTEISLLPFFKIRLMPGNLVN